MEINGKDDLLREIKALEDHAERVLKVLHNVPGTHKGRVAYGDDRIMHGIEFLRLGLDPDAPDPAAKPSE